MGLQIPLAKKLETCGIFGVSSDEYLNYAQQNRAEWEERGHEIVAEWVAELTKEDGGHDSEVEHHHGHVRQGSPSQESGVVSSSSSTCSRSRTDESTVATSSACREPEYNRDSVEC